MFEISVGSTKRRVNRIHLMAVVVDVPCNSVEFLAAFMCDPQL